MLNLRSVAAVVAGVEIDLVVSLLLVLQEDGQLAQVDVPLLVVVFAGDRAKVEHFQVSASVSVTLSMYGSWFPSVSTGRTGCARRSIAAWCVAGTAFQGVMIGTSTFLCVVVQKLEVQRGQVSNLASLAILSTASISQAQGAYVGWNGFR